MPVGAFGSIDFFVSDATDVVIDISGYFAYMTSGGLSLYNVSSTRGKRGRIAVQRSPRCPGHRPRMRGTASCPAQCDERDRGAAWRVRIC